MRLTEETELSLIKWFLTENTHTHFIAFFVSSFIVILEDFHLSKYHCTSEQIGGVTRVCLFQGQRQTLRQIYVKGADQRI